MIGGLKKKILLVLSAGIALSAAKTPNQQFKIIKEVVKEWKSINKYNLQRAIKELYKSQLVEAKENPDGTVNLILSKNGKQVALRYKLENMSLRKPEIWDKKWRVVMFDIPEKHKKARDALRFHLKQMKFFEYQKSVFVTPYPCLKEIIFVSEFYRVKPFVRHVIATKLDNELHLKSHFGL